MCNFNPRGTDTGGLIITASLISVVIPAGVGTRVTDVRGGLRAVRKCPSCKLELVFGLRASARRYCVSGAGRLAGEDVAQQVMQRPNDRDHQVKRINHKAHEDGHRSPCE